MVHKRIFIATLLLCSFSAYGENKKPTYLCIEDKSTGLFWSDARGEWYSSSGTANKKYLVKPDAELFDKKYPYGVFEFGNDILQFQCERGFQYTDDSGEKQQTDWLSCKRIGSFRMNRKSGRFMTIYPVGYLDGQDNNSDNPHITIGTCSPL